MYTILTISNANSVGNYNTDLICTINNNIPSFIAGCLSGFLISLIFYIIEKLSENRKNRLTAVHYLLNLSKYLDKALEDKTLESYNEFDKKNFETRFPPLWNRWIKHSFMNKVSNDLYSERSFINEKLNKLIYALKSKEDKFLYSQNREEIEEIIFNTQKDLKDSSYNLVQLANRIVLRKIKYELRPHVERSEMSEKATPSLKNVSEENNDSVEPVGKVVKFRERINFTELVARFNPIDSNVKKKFYNKLLALLEHYEDDIMGVKRYDDGFRILLFLEMDNDKFLKMNTQISDLLIEFDFKNYDIHHAI